MSRLISTIISGVSRPHFPFVVLESSRVQSSLPVLRAFVGSEDAINHVLLFSLLYPPSTLAEVPCREALWVVDRTADVPGYSESSDDLAEFILNRIKQGMAYGPHIWNASQVVVVHGPYLTAADGPLTVVIDSADVLCADLESPSKSYALIVALLSSVLSRPSKSRCLLSARFCHLPSRQSPRVSFCTSLPILHCAISS